MILSYVYIIIFVINHLLGNVFICFQCGGGKKINLEYSSNPRHIKVKYSYTAVFGPVYMKPGFPSITDI